jgi:phospholipase C
MKPINPIEHVVLIVKENHAFDNYLGTFPSANGATLPGAADPPPHDQPHEHAAWLNPVKGAMQLQYQEADIPGYFAYARQFTLCDNYFTEVASQSTPNHLMLFAADSPSVKAGMQWTVDRVTLLGKSKYWTTTAIFITWDDWGGWFDHVSPPLKDTWKGAGPERGPLYTNTQFSYGPHGRCLMLEKGLGREGICLEG